MQSHPFAVLTVGMTLCVASALTSACASNPPPAAQAAAVVSMQCDSPATEQDAAQILNSAAVLDVKPVYSHIGTANNGSEERVSGAKLVVRPPAGVTAEQMTRILQCRSARILLGQMASDAVSSDPYWLPDTWVNIDVKPENGNFAITASADTVHDNLALFGRVKRYADQHMLAVDPGLP
jgi:hypothetical protein